MVCRQSCLSLPLFFFFQAEDGIRDVAVTGVQTCALPISLPVPVRARGRPRASHGGPAGSPLARVHPERARRARPGVPGRARERLLGGPAARPRRQVGDLPRQGRRKFDLAAPLRGDPARPLRRLLRHRPRRPSDPADRRHRVGPPRLRRRRHALRRDDGARAGPRGALPRPPAAGPGAGAPGRGEGDRGGAAGRAARRGRPRARTPRRRRHDLSHRRRPHLRRHPGSMTSRERALGWLAGVGLTAGLVMAFGVAPREATQGNVQRIMYLHVPAILVAYLAFGVVLVASVVYLWGRAAGADRLAHASAEVGVVFTGINIATGAIWGKRTWGTWWTWDARLTWVSIMFVMYLGYLLLRTMIEDRERAARFAAVLGIIAALDIPLVHFSVLWWRTLHQPPTLLRPGPTPMDPAFVLALMVNLVAFVLLYGYFTAKRVRLLRQEEEVFA